MKILELLIEGYTEQLISATNDILATARGSGQTSVSTDKLVQTLNSQGFNVNRESILMVLDDSPFVTSATSSEVQLAQGEGSTDAPSGGSDVSSDEKVSQMADNAVDI